MADIDLKAAINAVSDVIQNRPRPLRIFDQIYMKAGDMVLQSEFVARWADGKRLVFVGDGDAIGVCIAYLRAREIVDYGPKSITVMDFDERIVRAVERFADKERLESLDAVLYNAIDPLPEHVANEFDYFYTNPPWGASNEGQSVNVFAQRGMEAIRYAGQGLVVIADDETLEWTRDVLLKVQSFASESGFFVSRMMPNLHSYHLDDNPELRSCNLILKSVSDERRPFATEEKLDPVRLENFYGADAPPRVRYVKEMKRVDYGMASDEEYGLELFQERIK